MKKIIIAAALIIISTVIFSCGKGVMPEFSLPEEMPDDFEIVFEDWIEESNKNIFDTFEGYIQKDLVTSGTARAEFTPSAGMKAEIYSMVRACALDKINCYLTSAEIGVTPCTYYSVRFTADGKTYTLEGDYTMRDHISDEEDAENFWNFIVFIRDLYRSTDEYKSLPEAEGGYC